MRVIIRRNQGHVSFPCEVPGKSLAVLRAAVVQDDFAAVSSRRGDLRRRRIVRHDNRCLDPEQARGQCDCLPVVAGRERGDARLPLRFVELRDRVVRPAKLEGAHALEVLALEEELRPGRVVRGARGRDRGPVRHAAQALGGIDDVGEGRRCEWGHACCCERSRGDAPTRSLSRERSAVKATPMPSSHHRRS